LLAGSRPVAGLDTPPPPPGVGCPPPQERASQGSFPPGPPALRALRFRRCSGRPHTPLFPRRGGDGFQRQSSIQRVRNKCQQEGPQRNSALGRKVGSLGASERVGTPRRFPSCLLVNSPRPHPLPAARPCARPSTATPSARRMPGPWGDRHFDRTWVGLLLRRVYRSALLLKPRGGGGAATFCQVRHHPSLPTPLRSPFRTWVEIFLGMD